MTAGPNANPIMRCKTANFLSINSSVSELSPLTAKKTWPKYWKWQQTSSQHMNKHLSSRVSCQSPYPEILDNTLTSISGSLLLLFYSINCLGRDVFVSYRVMSLPGWSEICWCFHDSSSTLAHMLRIPKICTAKYN